MVSLLPRGDRFVLNDNNQWFPFLPRFLSAEHPGFNFEVSNLAKESDPSRLILLTNDFSFITALLRVTERSWTTSIPNFVSCFSHLQCVDFISRLKCEVEWKEKYTESFVIDLLLDRTGRDERPSAKSNS